MNKSFFSYLYIHQVYYEIFSSLVANDFPLKNQVKLNYQEVVSFYIFSCSLKKYFALAIQKLKQVVDEKVILKFFN